MIESRFWKEHLAEITQRIRPVIRPRRWSERAVCEAERDVMIGFFVVRRMIELNKISTCTANLKLSVFNSPARRAVTKMNRVRIDQNYDLDKEKSVSCSVSYISNQCIHSYLSFVLRGEDRNWSDLLIVSDFDRNKGIWRVPFTTIISLFEAVSQDWPSEIRMIYDDDKKDYVVTAG